LDGEECKVEMPHEDWEMTSPTYDKPMESGTGFGLGAEKKKKPRTRMGMGERFMRRVFRYFIY